VYLREMSRTPLLTADEEVQLAQEMEGGRSAHAQLERSEPSEAERHRLAEALRTGEAARQRLIEANLRLVVSVARKYLGRGVSFLDLV
jgi:RNA polymerase primary sigma factor